MDISQESLQAQNDREQAFTISLINVEGMREVRLGIAFDTFVFTFDTSLQTQTFYEQLKRARNIYKR